MKKRSRIWLLAVSLAAGTVVSLGIRGAEPQRLPTHQSKANRKAICIIHPLNDSGVEGAVTFSQRNGVVEVDAEVNGLSPGMHGFHIHEFGDCTADGSSAGGHFNPTNSPHGAPTDARRHIGDLGNLNADKQGVAEFHLNDHVIRLDGGQSIIGRSIIIHENADDLRTQPSGNAGKRIAGGVIGIAKP